MKFMSLLWLLAMTAVYAGDTAEGPAQWTRGPFRLNEDRVMLNFDYLKRKSIRWKYEKVDNTAWKTRFQEAYNQGKTRVKVDYTPIYGVKDGKPVYKNIQGYRIEKAEFYKPKPPAKKKKPAEAEPKEAQKPKQ